MNIGLLIGPDYHNDNELIVSDHSALSSAVPIVFLED